MGGSRLPPEALQCIQERGPASPEDDKGEDDDHDDGRTDDDDEALSDVDDDDDDDDDDTERFRPSLIPSILYHAMPCYTRYPALLFYTTHRYSAM